MPQLVRQILAVDGCDVVVICLVDLVGTLTLLRRGVVLVKFDRPVLEFLCVESLRLGNGDEDDCNGCLSHARNTCYTVVLAMP